MRVDNRGNILGGVVQMVHYNEVLLSTLVPELSEPGLRAGAWEFIKEATDTSRGVAGGMVLGDTLPHPQLWSVNLDTMTSSVIYAADGADKFFAGDGRWAAWTGPGPGKPALYFDSYGYRNNDWAPLGVDNVTGLIAVCPEAALGRGLGVWNGVSLTIIFAGPLDSGEACFRDGLLFFRAQGQLKCWSATYGYKDVVQSPATGVRHSGDYAIGWLESRGICVYNWKTGVALSLHPANTPPPQLGHDCNSDLADLNGIDVKLASSYLPGELLDEVQVYDIDFVSHTVNGQSRDAFYVQMEVPVPAPKPPATNRNIWRGLCATNWQPGNCVWAGVPGDSRFRFDGMPWAKDVPIGQLPMLGISPREPNQYPTAEIEFQECLTEIRRRAALGEITTLVVYDDAHRPFTLFDWMNRCAKEKIHAIPGLFGYPDKDQTAEQTRDAVLADIANLKSHGFTRGAIFRAVYTRNGEWDKTKVYKILEYEDTILEADPFLVADLLFGMGRPGGAYQDWPELHTWYAQRCVGLGKAGPSLYDGDSMKTKRIYLRSLDSLAHRYMNAELGATPGEGSGLLVARTDSPSSWCQFDVLMVDGVWDVGKSVMLRSADAGGHRFVTVSANGQLIAVKGLMTEFIVARGEVPGTWALVSPTTAPVTIEQNTPGFPVRARLSSEGQWNVIGSWQSLMVAECLADGSKGKELTQPF